MLKRDEDIVRGEFVFAKVFKEVCVGGGGHVDVGEAGVFILGVCVSFGFCCDGGRLGDVPLWMDCYEVSEVCEGLCFWSWAFVLVVRW